MENDFSRKYKRYHIETRKAPNISDHPQRFNVRVSKLGLAKLLLKECLHYGAKPDVIASRPCVYGVFSGPLGGFVPREKLCVGCLRCTTQYPEIVQITHNPKRQTLGDNYFTPDCVDTVIHEAETGRVPIKGAGYRGKFGGTGWDSMWTDMSEIVRPTRDGIHGREFISTTVDMGSKPPFLELNAQQKPIGSIPSIVNIPIPLLFDAPPTALENDPILCNTFSKAAQHIQSFAILPLKSLLKNKIKNGSIIPLIDPNDQESLQAYSDKSLLLEMDGWNREIYLSLREKFPETQIILRVPFEKGDLLDYYKEGVRLFHLTTNYHGRNGSDRFVLELIRDAHKTFVTAGCRDQVTLIGSGGIVAAEHLPKAIICGLDVVAIDTPLLVALQARFGKACIQRNASEFILPHRLYEAWGVQRLMNLANSWRDQLLEILGAMGLREVRRLRGEMGRAMFQGDLEKEAFAGIEGYETER